MISFCIPARNEEKNLPQTIKAIQKACIKAKTEFEIIVCNNNSTDATEAVAKKLGAKVIPLAEPNISKARNTAARAAKGDILIFVDADTVLKDTVVGETLIALENRRYKVVTQIARHKKYPNLTSYGVWFYNTITILTGIGSGHFVGIKKASFKELGMFDEKVFAYEDILFYKKARKLFGARSIKVITRTGYTSYRKYEDGHNLKKFLLGLIGTLLNFNIARNRDNLEYWYGMPTKKTMKQKVNKLFFVIILMLLVVDSYFPHMAYLQDPVVRNIAMLTIFSLGTFILIKKPVELLLLPLLFFIELIGLELGVPFGKYTYNTELFALLGVPLFIPLAWFVLIKGTYLGVRGVITTAFFVLAFDIILELHALKNGLWLWEGVDHNFTSLLPAPVSNYISWFGISIVIVLLIKAFKGDKKPDRYYGALSLLAIMHYITSTLANTPGGLLGLLVILIFIAFSLVNAIKEV
jgi:glycosyltransferase involved in cell wall biosynthesis